MGLHKIIETPEKLKELFIQYKSWAKSNPILAHDFIGKEGRSDYREKERPLTMEGFENFVAEIPNMPLSLDQYFSNREERYSDFVSICSYVRRIIREDQISGGMAGIYNPSITQRLTGLVDKKEVENSGTINITAPAESDGLGE